MYPAAHAHTLLDGAKLAGHFWHAVPPSTEMELDGHFIHSYAPAAGEYCPGGQGKHVLWPVLGWNEPAGQGEHAAEAGVFVIVPALQGRQEVPA